MSTAPTSRFDLLDGVRGVAAIAVMLYHYTQHNGLHWLGGAWMAVDLFFVLSGFVIAHSFGSKILLGMGFWTFVRLRLVRLGPLYLVGLALGLLANGVLMAQGVPTPFSGLDLAKATALGMLWLPYFNDIAWPIGTHAVHGPVFPLNDPAWSLFFEMVINLAFYGYVFNTGRLSGKGLVAGAVAIFVGCTLYFRQFNPGWGEANFVFGFPRVTAEFFLGALIYQLRLHQKRASLPLAVLTAGLSFSFFWTDFARSSLVNSLVFLPLTLVFFSRIAVQSNMRALCAGLGELSYPLYIVHFPVYRLAFEALDLQHAHPVGVAMGVSALSLTLAWLLAEVDKQIRQKLLARMF